jgi:anti-anti-sigma factor
MEIRESSANEVPLLILTGRLDGRTAPILEDKISSLLATGINHLVFDCSGVDYASSAGLRVFLSTAKKLATAKGRCGFAALAPNLREIFEVSGFLQVLEIHPSVADATIS